MRLSRLPAKADDTGNGTRNRNGVQEGGGVVIPSGSSIERRAC